MPVPNVETVNGGFGIKNPLLANSRLQQALNTQELGKWHSARIYFISCSFCYEYKSFWGPQTKGRSFLIMTSLDHHFKIFLVPNYTST